MDIADELEILVDVVSSVVFVEIDVCAAAEECFHKIRLDIEIEIFVAEDDEWHIFGIDAVDLYKRFLFAFFVSSDILFQKRREFLILVL